MPFNPKPEATAGSGTDCPLAAPAVASGFGLNGETISPALVPAAGKRLLGIPHPKQVEFSDQWIDGRV